MRLLAPLVLVLVAAGGGRAAPIVSLDLLDPSVPATGTGQLAVRLTVDAGGLDLSTYTVAVTASGGPVRFTASAYPATGYPFDITTNPPPGTESFAFNLGLPVVIDPLPSPSGGAVTLNDVFEPFGGQASLAPGTYTLAVLTFEGTNTGGAASVPFGVLLPEFFNAAGDLVTVEAGAPVTLAVGAADDNPPPVPEPLSVALFAAAGAGAWRLRRRAG